MHQYCFEICDGAPENEDVLVEFATEEEAVLAAVQLAGELLRDAPRRFIYTQPWSVRVLNEDAQERYVVMLGGSPREGPRL